jgi:hypothetical protein
MDLFNWRHFIESLKEDIDIVEILYLLHKHIEPMAKAPISQELCAVPICQELPRNGINES